MLIISSVTSALKVFPILERILGDVYSNTAYPWSSEHNTVTFRTSVVKYLRVNILQTSM